MAISTYTELKAAIADYLARSDLTSAIPDYVTLCEAKLNRELHCRQMEVRATTTVDTASTSPEFITLPNYFQAMRWIRLSSVAGKPRLEYMSPTQLTEFRYGGANASGRPLKFTILASEIELCPTPDENYTVEMVYRRYIPALSGNETNWLLTLAPDVYLYGALMEAAPYLQHDERIPVWSNGFNGAIAALNKLNLTAAFNAGPMSMAVTGATP